MLARIRQILATRPVELEPREAYRLWAPNYPPRPHNLLMEIEQAALLPWLPEVRGRRVLDAACGSGRYAAIVRERGGKVIGLDFSAAMLARAEHAFARVQGDLCAIPLPNACMEVIVCGLALGDVSDLAAVLHEFARVLCVGGVLVYSDLHATWHARGWKRTFRGADNRPYAVRYRARDEAEHRRALEAAGLRLEAMRSIGVDDAWARMRAEAARFRARWGDTPVMLLVRAVKP